VTALVQVSTGFDVEITRHVELGIGGQFDFIFSDRTVGSPPVQLFAPGLFSLRLGIGFRF
jgi:hypothetical protein